MSDGYMPARPVSVIFALCLGVSIGLHIVTVLLVAHIWTIPAGVPATSYLEMRDLVSAPPTSSPSTLAARTLASELSGQSALNPTPHPTIPVESEEPVSERIATQDIRRTPLDLGMTYGFISSLGDGATLREDIRDYYLALVEKINTVWWQRAGALAEAVSQDGIAVIAIRRDGTLIDRGIRKGTGSPETDQALLDSIDMAAPMPSLPASYGSDVFTAPLKITAPSHLFRITTD